jgi:serine phosphatase RsbU (regulator of sigma subunit)
VSEAANENEEEFGEDRVKEMLAHSEGATPAELCDQIMSQVAAFASAGPAPDDRTLMVVRFQRFGNARSRREPGPLVVEAVA